MESRRPIVRFFDLLYYLSRPGGSYYRLVPNDLFEEGELLFLREVNERLGIKPIVYAPPIQYEVEHSDGLAEVVEDDVIGIDDMMDPDTGDFNDFLDTFNE
jgi:hypothetical protein